MGGRGREGGREREREPKIWQNTHLQFGMRLYAPPRRQEYQMFVSDLHKDTHIRLERSVLIVRRCHWYVCDKEREREREKENYIEERGGEKKEEL